MIFFGRGLGRMASDSLYFTYLAEFGIPGLILLIYILILFLKGGFKIHDSTLNPQIKVIARSILCFNFIFLVINITGNHINEFPGNLYFWFWNGVLLKLNVLEPPLLKEDSISPASIS
jgi:O-antigen ligase